MGGRGKVASAAAGEPEMPAAETSTVTARLRVSNQSGTHDC